MGAVILQSRRLELTCGEAPFWHRYDAATGEMIPVVRQVLILDASCGW